MSVLHLIIGGLVRGWVAGGGLRVFVIFHLHTNAISCAKRARHTRNYLYNCMCAYAQVDYIQETKHPTHNAITMRRYSLPDAQFELLNILHVNRMEYVFIWM